MTKLDNAIPIGRMAKPEEIGSVVAFLAGPGASYLPRPRSSPTAASCRAARGCEGPDEPGADDGPTRSDDGRRRGRWSPSGGHRRRRVRRSSRHPAAGREAGRCHTGRPAQSPPVPAPPLPDGDRDAGARPDRSRAPAHRAQGEERAGATGRGERLRPRAQGGPRHRGRPDVRRVPLRQPHRGRRCDPVVLRARGVRLLRSGHEDPR